MTSSRDITDLIKMFQIDTMAVKKELKLLPEILNYNELILHITSGVIIHYKCLIVATNTRLLILYKFEQLNFKLNEITSVSYKIGLLFGRITICTKSNNIIIKQCTKKSAINFTKILNEYIL